MADKPSNRLIDLRGNNRLSETIERKNDDKIVVVHRKHHTPKYGDIGEYVAWEREVKYVRSDGQLVVHQHTESYHVSKEEMVTVGKSPFTHKFDLCDDNQTVEFDGRTWVEYAHERSKELTNTRFWKLRKGKPTQTDAKEAVKEAIESNL
jgi:hypothetical protein